jgi:hypothetical protein
MRENELETERMRLLWQLVNPSRAVDLEGMPKLAEQLLLLDDKNLSFLPLSDVFNNPNQLNRTALQMAAIRNWRGLLFPQQLVLLTSRLFKDRNLSLKEAVQILISINPEEKKRLNPQGGNVVEAAEMVSEDAGEGFMDLGEDDAFLNAVNFALNE